jgi:hypothetical protein
MNSFNIYIFVVRELLLLLLLLLDSKQIKVDALVDLLTRRCDLPR